MREQKDTAKYLISLLFYSIHVHCFLQFKSNQKCCECIIRKINHLWWREDVIELVALPYPLLHASHLPAHLIVLLFMFVHNVLSFVLVDWVVAEGTRFEPFKASMQILSTSFNVYVLRMSSAWSSIVVTVDEESRWASLKSSDSFSNEQFIKGEIDRLLLLKIDEDVDDGLLTFSSLIVTMTETWLFLRWKRFLLHKIQIINIIATNVKLMVVNITANSTSEAIPSFSFVLTTDRFKEGMIKIGSWALSYKQHIRKDFEIFNICKC